MPRSGQLFRITSEAPPVFLELSQLSHSFRSKGPQKPIRDLCNVNKMGIYSKVSYAGGSIFFDVVDCDSSEREVGHF